MDVARGSVVVPGEGMVQDARRGAMRASTAPGPEVPRDVVSLGGHATGGNPVMPRPFVPVSAGRSASQSPPDAWAVLADYRPFQDLASNREFEGQFQEYIEWVASLDVPDAAYVLPHREDRDIHFTSVLFHEKVEFQQWLALGHRLADVMDLGYYQSHYEQVYPLAHGRAVTEEMALLHEYARRRDLPAAPSLAYVLMSPLAEERKLPVARLMGRLRFNPEMAGEAVTRADLEAAARLFEDGGFAYPDRAAHIEEALRCLEQRPNRVSGGSHAGSGVR